MAGTLVKEPRAPFPYFGGKRNAAQMVWNAFGDPQHYVEPFCGSCAMLLSRPASHVRRVETVNDKDGMLVNVWRAIRYAPDEVARECAIPVMECELHARLATTKARMTPDFVSWIEGDERHFDAHLAANWLYCTCASIGTCWNDDGPWHIVDGRLVKVPRTRGVGINRELPHIGNAGRGIHRKLPHIGNAGRGINRKLPHIGDMGRGINRKLPHIGNAGRGESKEDLVRQYLAAISRRLERVRICCGDWMRIVKSDSTLLAKRGNAAVFLDPPYATSPDLYFQGADVTSQVREWCANNGGRENVRIALCGYNDDHDALLSHGWTKVQGKAGSSGMNKDKANACKRERIWFSPYCNIEKYLI